MYLAIDTSSEFAGLSIIENGIILVEISWCCGSNHTVELLPHLDLLFKQSSIGIHELKGIIIASGPGSFNGLRVGLGTAKGLAFSLGIPIVGVNTLEAAAYQHAECGLPVCAIFKAGKCDVASASYQQTAEGWQCLIPSRLTTIEEICAQTHGKTVFCGEPTTPMLDQIRKTLGTEAVIPSMAGLLRRPGFLAELGGKRLENADYDDTATLQPFYLRPPHISPPKSKGSGAIAQLEGGPVAGVIWDMDGTIVDTASKHYDAWKTVFSSHGVTFSKADFKNSFGLRNDDIILEILGPRASPEEILSISREKTELFRAAVRREGVSPMPGAIELLTSLHKIGIPMAVASSAPTLNIETFIKMLSIGPLITAVASGEEVTRGKPAPDIFILAATKLNIKPGCCAVIEDAVGGISAAASAGMCSIGVAANHTKKSLELADIVVDSLVELRANDVINLIQRNSSKIKIIGGRKLNMERTLVLVKPDAVERGFSGAIIGRLESAGLTLVGLKMLQMDQTLAERHYAPHKEKGFFKGLISFITSGPIVAAVFEGEDAVRVARTVMGSTDPAKAEPGSIRKDFGLDIERNAVHGSDSVKTAEQEVMLFFKSTEILNYMRKQ